MTKKFHGILTTFFYKQCHLKQAILIGIWIFFLGILSSCEEKTDWAFPERSYKTIVVDAILTNEIKHQEIRLTRPFSNPNGTPDPVSGAQVTVQVEGLIFPFTESPDQPGLYKTLNAVAAVIDKTYELVVEVDNKVYTASAKMLPVAPFSHPSFQFVPDTGLYKISWNNPQYSPFDQAMYEADISWGHLPGFDPEDTLTKAKMLYYTLNTIDVSYVIFPQDKKDVYFPKGSIAILKKFSLTDDYTAYLRALLAETEWQGSLFEEARGNLPTNISNGGLGYFSACSVVTDTVVVE